MSLSRRDLLRWSAALAAVAAAPATAGTAGAGPAAGGDDVPGAVAADASPRFRAVAESLRQAMSTLNVPGAALGILADGREEHAAFGFASTEGAVPVTAETLFQIGSLNKTYTGTAAMRLVDAGRLGLDAPVRSYLPDLRLADESVAQAVTARHLLTHTGGWWGDYFSNTGTADDAVAIYTRYVLPTLEQLAPLGGFFSYNNAGFVLLGRVIEVLTGRPYRAAAADLVLDPLGLTRSTFVPEQVLRRPHATGYTAGAAPGAAAPVPVEPLFLPRSIDPAGGLWSTTADQLRYARFHMGDGTAAGGRRLLQPETLRLMQTPQIGIPGQGPLTMGMGWFVLERGGLRLLYHGGDTFGQHTEFWIAPDAGFALVVFANAQPGGAVAGPLAFAEALRQYFGVGGGAASAGAAAGGASAPPPPLALPPGALAAYGGRYETPNVAVDVRPDGDALTMHVDVRRVPGQVQPLDQQALPPDAQATIVAPDVALVTAEGVGVPIQFLRRPDGSVGWLSLGARLFPRSDSAPPPPPPPPPV
jgi:CubicO group peptidase (beta-lactamase class C family)